jgi:predicted nucleic acid-binding protein
MTLVVDASATVKAALAAEWPGNASHHELVAPSLLWSELASALRQLVYRGDVETDTARHALSWFGAAAIKVHPSSALIQDAFDLSLTHGWAKTYDAEYVVLARRLKATLLTDDARLKRRIGGLVTVVGPTEV